MVQNLQPLESYEIIQENQQYNISQPTQNYQVYNDNKAYQTYQSGVPTQITQSQQIYNAIPVNQNYQTIQSQQTYQLAQPTLIQSGQNQQYDQQYDQQYAQYNQTILGNKRSQQVQMQTEGYKTNQIGGARAKLIRGKNEINQNYIYQDYNPNINTGRNNEPRDSYSKIHIESRNNTNLKKGTLSARHNKGYSLYNRIPQLISFEDIYTKKRHLKSNIDIEKENLSEYV